MGWPRPQRGRSQFIVAIVLLLAGCATQPPFTPTPTKTPDPGFAGIMPDHTPTPLLITEVPPTEVPTPLPVGTEDSPKPSITRTPTDTPPPPTPDDGLPPDHYMLFRPIPAGWRDFLDRTYPYGGTAGGQYRPHTGVEFPNPISTPVIATGNAVVHYARPDSDVQYGPQLNFYGNMIVLQFTDFTANGLPVYGVYGHLSEIYVETGQAVPVQEIIGAVGATGVAAGGAHLHFEVRVGDPQDYFGSTRNPDLWIKPYIGFGTLAGRVVDGAGNYVRNASLTITDGEATRYTWTYAGDENRPDETWGENFTYGDLPEGWYTVTTRSNRTYTEQVYVRANRTAWLEIIFD